MKKYTQRTKMSLVLGMVATTLMATMSVSQHLLGWLVGNLGISQATAFAIVALIGSGGLDAAALVYPIIAPFVGTIQFILAVVGAAAVVGW